VEIKSPKIGEKVGATPDVTGTATIKAGYYVWAFAHKKGLNTWWPQGAGPAEIKNDEFTVSITLGQDRDRGSSFEIVVGVVDREANNKLLSWFRKGDETGNYPGIPLPPVVKDCGDPPRVTVLRVE
jgi:hypothetical protein